MQKVEQLKHEIEQTKVLKLYFLKENEELEEKLKIIETENNQNLLEYEIKKHDLDERLKRLKNQIKKEQSIDELEVNKYQQVLIFVFLNKRLKMI